MLSAAAPIITAVALKQLEVYVFSASCTYDSAIGLRLVQLGVNPSVVIRGNLTHKTSPGNHRRISASVY